MIVAHGVTAGRLGVEGGSRTGDPFGGDLGRSIVPLENPLVKGAGKEAI